MDHYLSSTIRMDIENRIGPPRFILETGAVADPICSYRRTFAYDPASGRYQPDAPLPRCDDYFEQDG